MSAVADVMSPLGARGETRTMATILLVVGAIGLVVGLVMVWPKLIHGGVAFNQGTDMMWGLPVVAYAYLALASFGLSMVAALGSVFRLYGFERLAPRLFMLALAVSVGALAALALELGYPLRTLWAIPMNMQIGSPMLWMGGFWGIYIVLLLTMLLRLRQRSVVDPGMRGLAVAISLAGVGALFTQGLVYGMLVMRPVWYGAATPLYFTVGALLAGIALAVLFVNLAFRFNQTAMPEPTRWVMSYSLPVILLVALVGYAISTGARLMTGLWSNAEGVQIVYQHLLGSPWFWFDIIACVLLPLALLASANLRTSAAIQGLVAALVLVGLFISRYEFIIGGQLVPLWKGSWIPALVDYAPNAVEWGVVIVGVSLAVLVYAIGDRFFNTGPHAGD